MDAYKAAVDALVKVTVTFAAENATVKVGAAAVTSKEVKAGETVAFTVEPAEGYVVVDVKVGETVLEDVDGTYTTAALSANVTVTLLVCSPVMVPSALFLTSVRMALTSSISARVISLVSMEAM